MNLGGIVEIDVHGMTVSDALYYIEREVANAPAGTYRVRVIHGFNNGTRIKDAIARELGHGLVPKIKRIVPGVNQGTTELVLKDYY